MHKVVIPGEACLTAPWKAPLAGVTNFTPSALDFQIFASGPFDRQAVENHPGEREEGNKIKADNEALARWQAYIATLNWEKGHLDHSSWCAFLRARSLGIERSTALATVTDLIRRAGDSPRTCKLQSQVERAFEIAEKHARKTLSELRENWIPRQPKPTFDPARAETLANRIPPEIDFAWLKKHSPLPVDGLSPNQFLEKLYTLGQHVLIFDRCRSQGQALWQHGVNLERFTAGKLDGVWFLSNPVDGAWREVQRLKKEFNPTGRTRRACENIVAWPYAVLECDHEPKERWLPLWLRILVQLPLPIASITTSGGKSIHAITRVRAATKQEWDQIVRRGLLPRLVPLGADPKAMTAVRLTRLPGCYRGAALQELLYLNPCPTNVPIFV
jgi:hypothetical protein